MPKISMLLSDADLAEIDAQAGGNRTTFMVGAAVERARALKRRHLDDEIAASVAADAEADGAVNAEWDVTSADGLDD